MKALTNSFYCLSAWFTGSGFWKLFMYELPSKYSLDDKGINAYVEGDAYNYIINSGRATAYFVLALLFFVIGTTPIILQKIGELNSQPIELATDKKTTIEALEQ
jgi:hypothetical protein